MLRDDHGYGESQLPPPYDAPGPTAGEMPRGDETFLKSASRTAASDGPPLRWVDLFAGCGAMSLGVSEAAAAKGRRGEVKLSVDFSPMAMSVFRDNFPDADAREDDVSKIFCGCEPGPLDGSEKKLRLATGEVDLLIGGPPCQGHSDLNNFSRRDDPRNRLYSYMARAADVFRPKAMIVENVRGVIHDRSGALGYASDYLADLGYEVVHGTVDVSQFGVAQKRVRHVLLATLKPLPELTDLLSPYITKPRSIEWAIGDLADIESSKLIDQTSRPSPDNMHRIAHLFDNGLHDLPDAQRPRCHRDKAHTYKSVYGRLRWEDQAQTVTSGFYSMCMGRYVHPSRQRTLTGHEAARLQFIPDSFSFDAVTSRSALAEMIGNAVPPKLSYVLVRALLERGII